VGWQALSYFYINLHPYRKAAITALDRTLAALAPAKKPEAAAAVTAAAASAAASAAAAAAPAEAPDFFPATMPLLREMLSYAVGPDRNCSPLHRMPAHSRDEGSRCV